MVFGDLTIIAMFIPLLILFPIISITSYHFQKSSPYFHFNCAFYDIKIAIDLHKHHDGSNQRERLNGREQKSTFFNSVC